MTWLRKAADRGRTVPMIDIAEMYLKGMGVTQSKTEARRWYQKAADGGDADAVKWLAAHPASEAN
jgi:TPR repeat protein